MYDYICKKMNVKIENRKKLKRDCLMSSEAPSIAFVLRHYAPYHEKIILFNRIIGKFQARICFPKKNNFFNEIEAGTLIEYNSVPHNKQLTIELKQIYYVPFALASNNILFLHHFLEICHFFISFESYDNSKIFDLLIFVYQVDNGILRVQTQKLFLFRLFALLGLYPEQNVFHN